MTRRKDYNTEIGISEVEGLFNDNSDMLRQMLQNMIQAILEEEIVEYLHAGKYERTEDRRGQRNGYKPRTINTRVGPLELQKPQSRDSGFDTKLFERYQRSEKALRLALIESYIQGVSTRKTKRITEELCGTEFSATTISNLTKKLDTELEKFRNRDLSGKEYKYLMIDARYEKGRKRKNGAIVDRAVLVVAGITEKGYREIIGVDVANLESEGTWSEIFRSMRDRGLHGVEYIVSDAHKGIKKAIQKEFTGCKWQRCRVHFVRNILNQIKKKDTHIILKALDYIFESDRMDQARSRKERVVEYLEDIDPKIASKIDEEIEETLTVLTLPKPHRKRMKSTNMVERLNERLKQRTKVVRIFPNDESCLRLITALLKEVHEDWITGRRYLIMDVEDEIHDNHEENEDEAWPFELEKVLK
ncbi:MAG: IS256 family transposase [bacterium]